MGNINVLSKEISELIAAGEVIERPSSVIKELIENSIDAGANLITVEIKNGGISYIRITDNGCGISKVDIPLAFIRHATSKISTKRDLESILTLGFRGEALASICAVSKVDVLSKVSGDEYGTHYVIEGTEEKNFESCGCPEGTTIVIRDIFYNVPARLKFLKKAVTEGNAIAGIVNKLALSHPEISFKFIRDNKQELLTAGDGKPYSAIYTVFGKDFAKSLIEVDYTYNNIRVTGFTVKPLLSKANRSFQNFFINNRYVKSITCTVSFEEAYKNSIMVGKFPACVLNIQIPPNIVDVNVHPAKIEVRFSDEKLIFDSIYFAIKNSLLKNDSPTELKIEPKLNFSKQELFDIKPETPQPLKQFHFIENPLTLESNTSSYLTDGKFEKSVLNDDISIQAVNSPPDTQKEAYHEILNEFKYINKDSLLKKEISESILVDDEKENKISVNVIGEAFLTYIIAQINDELVLIDKHAAHERHIFNKLKVENEILESQILMDPVDVLLTYEEYDAIAENLEIVKKIGFSIAIDTPPYVRIIGVPVFLVSSDFGIYISELAHNLLDKKRNPSLDILDELYHSIACKSAIKANDKTDMLELKALVEEIYKNDIRYCPHGRPVMIKMTKKDIEKQFKRVL